MSMMKKGITFLLSMLAFIYAMNGDPCSLFSSDEQTYVSTNTTTTHQTPIQGHHTLECIHHFCCALVPVILSVPHLEIKSHSSLFVPSLRTLSEIEPPFRPPIIA